MLRTLKLIINNIISNFWRCPANSLTTGRGTNKEVIDCLLHVQNTLKTNVSGQVSLVEGSKSLFEPISKSELKTGTEKKKKISTSLPVLKVLGLLRNKAEKLAEAFIYPT